MQNRRTSILIIITLYGNVFLIIYHSRLFHLIIVSNIANCQNVKKAWLKVLLKNCSRSEFMGKESLFFGPSNTIGDLPFIGQIFDMAGVSAELNKAKRITISVYNQIDQNSIIGKIENLTHLYSIGHYLVTKT